MKNSTHEIMHNGNKTSPEQHAGFKEMFTRKVKIIYTNKNWCSNYRKYAFIIQKCVPLHSHA